MGSPPRMRGKRHQKGKENPKNRITPAYAGKTPCIAVTLYTFRDHPRVCGENLALSARIDLRTGSPPRMRGKRKVSFRKSKALRITPAYAGKTHQHVHRTNQHQDHPRVCGENTARHSKPKRTQDHPRVCGENAKRVIAGTRQHGSPPRMRGKLVVLSSCCAPRRITPAYAGKTGKLIGLPANRADHPRVCGENTNQVKSQLRQVGSPPRMRGKH